MIISSENSFCPLDRKKFEAKKLDDLPVNILMKELVQRKSLKKFCLLHQEEATLVCLTDKCRICSSCEHSSEHEGHKVKHIKHVTADAKKKIAAIEQVISEYEIYQQRDLKAVADEKSQLIYLITRNMSDLRRLINDKEKKLVGLVDGIFKDNEGVHKSFEDGDGIIRTLKEDIGKLKREIIGKEFLKSLDSDLSVPLSLIMLKNKSANSKSVQEIISSFQQSLNDDIIILQQTFLDKISIHLEKFGEDQKYSQDNFSRIGDLFSFSKTSNQLTLTLNGSSHNAKFSLENFKDVQEVSLVLSNQQYSHAIHPDLNWVEIRLLLDQLCQSLTKVQKVILKIVPGALNAKDLKMLVSSAFFTKNEIKVALEVCTVTSIQIDEITLTDTFSEVIPNIKNLSELHIDLNGQLEVSDVVLEKLARYIYAKKRDFERFELLLSGTSITNEGVFQVLATTFGNAKVFRLNLSKTKITTGITVLLISNLLLEMKKIETLDLDFADTGLIDFQLFDEGMGLSNLRVFKLKLSNSIVSDRTAECIVKKGLCSMIKLEELHLDLSCTRVTSHSIFHVMSQLPGLKVFRLYLENTRVEDKILEPLLRKTPSDLPLIEDFELNLNGTLTTNLAVAKALLNIGSLNKFNLVLNNQITVCSKAALDECVQGFDRSDDKDKDNNNDDGDEEEGKDDDNYNECSSSSRSRITSTINEGTYLKDIIALKLRC